LPERVVEAEAHEAAFPGLPLLRFSGNNAARLHFAPPVDVTVVGSFATRTVVKVRADVRRMSLVPNAKRSAPSPHS